MGTTPFALPQRLPRVRELPLANIESNALPRLFRQKPLGRPVSKSKSQAVIYYPPHGQCQVRTVW